MYSYFVKIILFCFPLLVSAQDMHLAHIFTPTLITNPANTAFFNGRHRAFLTYRNQWSLAKTPYKSYFFVGDMVLGKPKKSNFGLGLSANRDVAGILKYGNTSYMLSLSSIISTGKKSELSLGIQGGVKQTSISSSGMTWDNQFSNGAFNASATSGENFNFTPFITPDFSVGISYRYNSSHVRNFGANSYKDKSVEFGFAVHHLLEPKIEFSSDTKLNRTYIFHYKNSFDVPKTNVSLTPACLYMRQGPHQEIGIGLMAKYVISEASKHTNFSKDFSISAGGYYRYNDAIVPSFLIEYDGKYAIGLTSGLNHSYVRNATNYIAEYEILFRFINL